MKIKQNHQVLLLYVGAVLLLLWMGRPQPVDNSTTQPKSDFTPYATLSGEVAFLHSDNESFTLADRLAVLHESDGDMIRLDGDVPYAYNGAFVSVDGIMLDNDASDDGLRIMHVQDIDLLTRDTSSNTQGDVQGNEKWVNIACRFGDMSDETPQPREYFEEIMVNSPPGMDHYWRQSSSQQVDIEGSAAYGWYDFSKPKSYYLGLPISSSLRVMMQECVNLAREADDVDFSQFGGINLMLNDKFGCCAWGGRTSVNVGGNTTKTLRTTWLPPWAYNDLHVIAHEMGHGWGLPHSSGPYGNVYDSAWDVMSGGSRIMVQNKACRVAYNVFGCMQVGTIGIHLDSLGWLPNDRVKVVNVGESQTFAVDSLTTAQSSFDTLLIKIPKDGKSGREFYTVEVRSFTGYDRNVPGEAVVLHEVMTSRSSPAHVVDADNNGNPNDEGAMWRVGETFEDDSSGITVEVMEQVGTTYVVRVTNDGR